MKTSSPTDRSAGGAPALVPGPDGWSRFVAAAKLGLPLAAVALLSSLFLVASRPGGEAAEVTFAEGGGDLEERVGAPRFAGVTSGGDTIALTAARARPDPAAPGGILAETVEALVDSGGRQLTMRAPRGRVAGDLMTVDGGVRIGTSDGWTLDAPRVAAALDRTEIVGDGPLSGAGPLGTVDAGALTMTADRLVLSGGVRVVYTPPERSP